MSLDSAFHSHRKILSFLWEHSPSVQKLKPICWWQSRWERRCTSAAGLPGPESSYLHSSCCFCFCHELKKRSGSHLIFQAHYPRFLSVCSGFLEKRQCYKLYTSGLNRGCLCGQTVVWPMKHIPRFLTDTDLSWQHQRRQQHPAVL